MSSLLLGSHTSVSGGIYKAFDRAASIGCTTMQVFVKNASQWYGKPCTDDDVLKYREAETKSNVSPVIAHAAYLINLCAANPAIRAKSREGFLDELRRCEMLGIRALVVHPGAHVGAGEEEGIKCIAESLNAAHKLTKGWHTYSALETTAGQGTTIGYRFEHLRRIIDLVEEQDRMAVCIDTCHLFAAGYPVHTKEGWDATIKEFDQVIGLDRLVAVHVNDSMKPFGSHLDRHEHIGKGVMGLEGFRALMNDPRLANIPKILETDKSEDLHEDVENMSVLRGLIEPEKRHG
ncbi:deoxyribonuclease IV [bacterium]|nr:MAG: deoxyribonuclease IV [bacterium]